MKREGGENWYVYVYTVHIYSVELLLRDPPKVHSSNKAVYYHNSKILRDNSLQGIEMLATKCP